MDLQSSTSSFPMILLVVLLFFTILIAFKIRRRNPKNLPPGPPKLPFIGNLHQLVGPLPHQTLRDLSQKYGPLMHIQIGEIPTVVVSSSEMAKQVMKKHDTDFATRPQVLAGEIMHYGWSDLAFAPCSDSWRQLRRICTSELLSTRKVQSFQPIREEEMSNLVTWIASKAGSAVNLSEKIFSLGYTITSRAAFGKKCKDQEKFVSVVEEALVKMAPGFHVGDVFPSYKLLQYISRVRPRMEKLHREADVIMSGIIEDHLIKKVKLGDDGDAAREDLIDALLKYVNRDDLEVSLTVENIKGVILDVFSAGSETSATVVDWAMAEMMKNPKILNKAQSEVRRIFDKIGKVEEDSLPQLQYLHLVIKETLRLHPPGVLLLPRECMNQCEIGGFSIPVKTRVIINAWAIGRDSNYWQEPEIFNPDRFQNSPIDFKGNHFEYIPFGAGRRMCPGVVFGMIATEYQLAMLLYHFDWELPNVGGENKLDMTDVFGLTVRRKNDLYLVPTPYKPPSSSSYLGLQKEAS